MKNYSSFLREQEFVIFLFHGVITKNRATVRNYTKKHLEEDKFERVISDLNAKGNAISMDEVASAHKGNRALPPYSYAISFDDGFANNFHIAAPILREHKNPAVFYVTSGFIANNDASWTDLIEYAVEQVEEVRFEHEYLSTTSTVTSLDEKISFLDKVREVVKNNHSIDPYQFARELFEQNEVEGFECDFELDQKMVPTELRQLSRDPLFTIGGHSHTHRIMSFLSQEDLKDEVSTSVRCLKEWTGQEVQHYSYPEGLRHCYSGEVINCLKEHDIICSPSAIAGSNNLTTNLFHLKRINVV
jgi:peptidoglycan/xylan/chitin deacetylase (PgdA/CDA1 family)